MNCLTKDDRGKPLCNFTIHVISVDKVYTNTSDKPVDTVQFCLDFGCGNTKKEEVYSCPVDSIDETHWEKLDKRCIYEPNVSAKRVERYLSHIVRKALTSVPERLVYKFSRVGMHTVNERPVFYTGTQLILSCHNDTDVVFEIEQVNQKLEVNENLSEEGSAAEFFRLLSLSPGPGQIILAYKLVYFMRIGYEKIGRVPKGCIFLYGKSGMQKTTFSSLLVQTYDRSGGIKNPSRLNTSIPAAVNMLLKNPNDVVIMDDLFPTDSKRIQRQMEETLIEIIRYIADGTTPARMKGKKLSQGYPQCGVIFTGEKLIGTGSDAARFLSVEMMKPDGEKLRYFQEHPLIVSTFYYHFISWFINHYDEVCEILKKLWKSYEHIDLNVHDRLREMYFFLNSSYFLFLQYLYEKKLLSEADARRLYRSFNERLVMLIKQQNERVKGKGSEKFENEDYLQRIRMLYKTGQMSIASDTETFDKEQHDGVLYRNRLYLRGNRISAYFPETEMKDIADSLEAQGVLETSKENRTKQISKLKGMRFYVIPLNKL